MVNSDLIARTTLRSRTREVDELARLPEKTVVYLDHAAGDHHLYIAEVVELVEAEQARPLLFFSGQYGKN